MTTPTEQLHTNDAGTVLDALIDGLRVTDARLNEHCELALQAIGPQVIPALTAATNSVTQPAHRRRLLAAIELVEDAGASSPQVGGYVWRALLDALRVKEVELNAKAIRAFCCLPAGKTAFELLSLATYERCRKGYSQRLRLASMLVGQRGS